MPRLRQLTGVLIFLACASFCPANLFSASSVNGNLFKNGDFEVGSGNTFSSWMEVTHGSAAGGRLTAVNDNLQAWSGNRCIKLEANPHGLIGVMQGSRIFPGKRYVISVVMRGTGSLRLQVIPYRLNGYHIAGLKVPDDFQRSFVFRASDQWERHIVQFTGPPGVHSMNLSVDTSSTGPLYVDAVSLSYFHPATVRFLPSVDKLLVDIDGAPVVEPLDPKPTGVSAVVTVSRRDQPDTPVLTHKLPLDANGSAAWNASTKALPEGDYVVAVRVEDAGGKVLATDDDWFEKRHFAWMDDPPWISNEAYPPYTPLAVDARSVSPWGRRYTFGDDGLLTSVTSQDIELLTSPMTLEATVGGARQNLVVTEPLKIESKASGLATARATLTAGELQLAWEIAAEYDGFVRYRLTYRPLHDAVTVNRLRLRVPMRHEHAFLYSVGTDRHGSTILGDVLPDRQGKLYDSLNDTRAAACSPTFCSLFWVAGYDTCFCYAADSDLGWVLRDDAPAVEAWREDDSVVLWLNLVDREYRLDQPRTLEFAFQAGPTKPVPAGWRGIQHGGNPDDAPTTIVQVRYQGATTGGGFKTIWPGPTQAIRDHMTELRKEELAKPNEALTGYIHYATIPKGLEVTRVYRSEWGIDKDTWESATTDNNPSHDWVWQQHFFGDDLDRYISFSVKPTPSYVACLSHGYDQVLNYMPLSGFYDDVGFPESVYEPELGLGGTDPQGRRVYSSGLWIYRQRYQQAALVNHLHDRPNYLKDSQHVRAHYMPAYGFIGLWAPCEHGYYNPDPDTDNLEFYGSLGKYLAHNPARQFGQVPMVGMSTSKWDEPGTDRDTRCMMMLTMLHDQDVGSFGTRNIRTVCRLRHARNRFRQWEPGVAFTGYWQSGDTVTTASPDTKVSYWSRPGSVLFAIGNVGDKDSRVRLQPDWPALHVDPAKLTAVDSESLAPVPLDGGALVLDVPRHDLRLVLAGDLQGYDLVKATPGKELPGPATRLDALCNPLTGPTLPAPWTPQLNIGHSGYGFVQGKLYVQDDYYGATCVRRPLDIDSDTLSVQVMILRTPSGCADSYGGSLFLYWNDGSYIQATPGYNRRRFYYAMSHRGSFFGGEINTHAAPDWYPYVANWVRIELRPKTVAFLSSADGKAWRLDAERPRPDSFILDELEPPWLLLGNGAPGAQPFLANPNYRYFRPDDPPTTTFFSDLVIGRP